MRPAPPLACALALLLSSASRAAVTPLAGRLESADNCQIASVTLTVDRGDTCVTTDSGAFVCGAPGLPGEEVRLILVRHPKCLIFYPPDGRTTLKRPEARESVAVTLVERDSPRWKSTEELRALLRASGLRKDSQGLTPQQLDEKLKAWAGSVREATGADQEAFVCLLVRKQGQIQEFTRVSEVFRRFLKEGVELVEAFERHAPEVPEIAGASGYLIERIRRYNPVFEELKVRGGSYQAIVGSYWGAEAAAGYGSLLAATLAVHSQTLLRVNDLNSLLNRLGQARLHADERQRLKGEVAERNAAWVAESRERLAVLEREVDAYLATLQAELAEF